MSGTVCAPYGSRTPLKVAVIGGGPGGLGAAIELSKLPFVSLKLYDKRSNLEEIGGGLTLQPQTWRLLERNGAAAHIKPDDYFRPAKGLVEQIRNGKSRELLFTRKNHSDVPPHQHSCRIARYKLQSALLKSVDQSCIHLSQKLVGVEHLRNRQVRITFEDGAIDDVDLLIAADGIRSYVRKACFPEFALSFNGQSVYRTIVSQAEVAKIPGIPWAPTFWKRVSGLYVFTCPLGGDDFEVTTRIRWSHPVENPVSWGRRFDFHSILHEYEDFCPAVQQILRLSARGATQEFALFSGPRLKNIVSEGSIAFIGDASHAMRGHFGSGAAFALEDAYTLARALSWARYRTLPLAAALEVFDSVRSPHYERLYQLIDRFAAIKAALKEEELPLDDEIAERVHRISKASDQWMFSFPIDRHVDEALKQADCRTQHSA